MPTRLPTASLRAGIDAVAVLTDLLDLITDSARTGATRMTAVPSFADVSLRTDSPEPPVTVAHATERIEAAAKGTATPRPGGLGDPEQIDVKPITRADRDGIAELSGGHRARRGAVHPRPVPDDVRQPAVDHPPVRGLSTAAESNAFYRRNLASGQKACQWPSTSPRTAGTIPTTRASPVTSAWRVWRSTRSSTCASCSTASTWATCRSR